MSDTADQLTKVDAFAPYEEIANKHLRTMRITTDARFEAAKRLRLINFICFVTTTIASLGLILIPLLDVAGINKIFSSITLTVIQVFLAVCVLVYSTAIATANFQIRSKEFLQCGDKIKRIIDEFKVHLVDVKQKNEKPNLEKYMNQYRKVLDGSENHEDLDYQHAFAVFNSKGDSKQPAEAPNKPAEAPNTPSKRLLYIPSIIIVVFEILVIVIMIGSYWFCDTNKQIQNQPSSVVFINNMTLGK